MIITILAEPRSGSTNLTSWFSLNKKFTTLLEPITCSECKWYKHGVSPKLWEYETPHLLIKEIYRPETDFSELIEISDKLIILHRENVIKQNESWLTARKTNTWGKSWVFKEELIKNEDPTYFNEIKMGIRDNYLNNGYFNISYEDLYYGNGFGKLLNYLDMEDLEDKNFPLGREYRIDTDINKLI
jgi:hypothetical protein